MDLYDPQTLGVMVFGGFMVISAIGIFLVSTFSMKETSYEEALAKQRREQEKGQQPKVDKKKSKVIEKKGKSKKKDEKPNGKLPEYEHSQDSDEQQKNDPEPVVVVSTKVPVRQVPVTAAVTPAPEKTPSPKDKKKTEVPVISTTIPAVEKGAPPSKDKKKNEVPVTKTATQAPEKSVPSTKDKKKNEAPAASVVAPVVGKAVPSTKDKKKNEVPVTPAVAPAPEKAAPSPKDKKKNEVLVTPAVAPAPEKTAPSPKDKKKKQEKKVQKVEPSPSPAVALAQATVPKQAAVFEVVTKEVPAVAVPPVGSRPSPPVTNSLPPKKAETVVNHEEAPKKKNASKKKSEAGITDGLVQVINELDGAIYLPYKTLVSTISSMAFSEGEAQKLIEILTEKNGTKQGTWHTATQKGDPVTALKKQLEEKEKQLSAEQEDAVAAKNRLRELNKELATEKTKLTGVESKLKEQIVSRDQEIVALQARMQASYTEHVKEAQQLQGKIRNLQEEIENGPKAQLARLQQENSILRDALNQATSQTESKQNAELAKLRQECSKLTKELGEKSDSLQQEEQRRKTLDVKIAGYEKQVSQLQTLQQESEATLQKRLDEVNEELRKSQSSYKSLLSDSDNAKEQQKSMADLQTKLMSYESESKQKTDETDRLNQKLQDVTSENVKLNERIKSIESLLEAGQSKDTETDQQQQESKAAEIEQLQARLQKSEEQISTFEKEIVELKDTIEQQKNKNNDLREKNWQAMDALGKSEKTWEEKWNSEKTIKESIEQQLNEIQTETKETLRSLFPQVTVESQQSYSEWLQEFREKSSGVLSQQSENTASSELLLKLKETEEAHNTVQAECEQYRTILAETEGMLKDLQKSVEQEEQVWKVKLTESEEELRKSQIQVKSLEDLVEKLKLDVQSTDQLKECISLMEAQLETQMNSASTECQNYSKEVEILRQLLSDSQEQLESTTVEARKQSKELSLLRQQLHEMQSHVHDRETHAVEEHQIKQEARLETPQSNPEVPTEEQNISNDLEEKSVFSLQEELKKLKFEGDSATGAEEAHELKERLDKEKKLTRDLGQAATKLLRLLKASQEQLAKEKECNKLLKDQLQETEEDKDENSGTSV
ncbi:ribosome-binding 1 isoform X1 [Pelobates cultripes]|uniref:Ribosome-binding 1 isoform X1 n=1 Tax=Pelobates cultripes TaxID=61616 RepID=A0AAD1RGZ5_PELCU|nr:ribosome-binding 1 isoform X1 [Pelobates cultripes]